MIIKLNLFDIYKKKIFILLMSFKIKNRKKKTVDNRTTIDAKHNNIVKKFKEEKKQYPS